jgi:DNA-binding MarR family transcriptional regulator
MRQLADEVILSKSGVTRLIDRLVDDGLVERSACLSDARGAEAVLTDRGLARLRAASKTHLRGIEEHFLAVLDEDQLGVIERALATVASQAGASSGADAGQSSGATDDADPGDPSGRPAADC